MAKRILITGGTGFLGRNLIIDLESLGYEICLTTRSTSDVTILSNISNLKYISIDKSGWENQITDWSPEIIIHTATSYGRKGESIVDISMANTLFPIKILNIALEMENTPVFINIDTSLTKDVNLYSLSKKQFLEWLNFYNRKIKIVNVILENFYGPGDGQFISNMIKKVASNVPEIDLTIGIQRRDFIYYKDVVSAFRIILDNLDELPDAFTEFEIGSGKSYSIKEVFKMIMDATGNTFTKLNWGSIKLRENEVMDSTGKISKICSLGWAPTVDLEDGIKKLIEDS